MEYYSKLSVPLVNVGIFAFCVQMEKKMDSVSETISSYIGIRTYITKALHRKYLKENVK